MVLDMEIRSTSQLYRKRQHSQIPKKVELFPWKQASTTEILPNMIYLSFLTKQLSHVAHPRCRVVFLVSQKESRQATSTVRTELSSSSGHSLPVLLGRTRSRLTNDNKGIKVPRSRREARWNATRNGGSSPAFDSFLLFFVSRQVDSLYRSAKDLLASLHRSTFIPWLRSRTDHRQRLGENRTAIERDPCASSLFFFFYHGNNPLRLSSFCQLKRGESRLRFDDELLI